MFTLVAFVPVLLIKVAMSSVTAVCVGRVCKYPPALLQTAAAAAAGGAPVALTT